LLKFYDYNISSLEVPDHISINFHVSHCQNTCENCFSSWLQKDEGNVLNDYFKPLLIAYKIHINCVCFLGEGKNTKENHDEFLELCNVANSLNIKTCLYSGRNCEIEEWMSCFDFVKTGAYIKDCGPLNTETTNQKFFKKLSYDKWEDITRFFWRI